MQNVEKSYCTFEWVEGLVKRLADSTFGREGKCDSFFFIFLHESVLQLFMKQYSAIIFSVSIGKARINIVFIMFERIVASH